MINHGKSQMFVVGLAVLLFVFLSRSYAAEDGLNKIEIRIGMQKLLKVPRISRVEIADQSILTVKTSGDTLYLTALKKGITNVRVWQSTTESTDYLVTTWKVLPENIKKMISDIPGAVIMPTGSKVTIMGALLTQKDEQRIQRIADVFVDDVDNLTYYDSQQSKHEALKHILKAIGNPKVNASFVGDNVALSGIVYSEEDKDRAGIAAGAYVAEKGKVSNTISVIDLPVEIDVVFVQLTPTSGLEIGADQGNLGILQGPSLEIGLKGDTSLQVGTVGYGLLNQKLTYLESRGLAKVIDKPHISTISGKPGRIQYGGEIGIKTTGTTGDGDVSYKDFGLILEVEPVVGPDNMITVKMNLEVSQPLTDVTSGADVEFQKFNTSTYGNVKVGETLVVSGLKQVIRERSKKNVPFIGKVPLLNLLFAYEKDSAKQTNIVVLLTPELPTIQKKYTGPKGSADAKRLYGEVSDPNMILKKEKPDRLLRKLIEQ